MSENNTQIIEREPMSIRFFKTTKELLQKASLISNNSINKIADKGARIEAQKIIKADLEKTLNEEDQTNI